VNPLSECNVKVWIQRYLSEVLGIPIEQVDLARTMDSYGLDSVEAVLMAGALEDELDLEIDPAVFLRYSTIEDFVDALVRQMQGRMPLAPLKGMDPLL